jgi:hypothetical protein
MYENRLAELIAILMSIREIIGTVDDVFSSTSTSFVIRTSFLLRSKFTNRIRSSISSSSSLSLLNVKLLVEINKNHD